MYTVEQLIGIAKRENNRKRPYLMVNRLQGKYMPALPKEALAMFETLAHILRREYGEERLLIVGFAETATAIGAAVAVSMQCPYIQTTREDIPGKEYLLFSEEHSHATEQRVVKKNLDFLRGSDTRVILIDDEVTTGRTILNLVSRLRAEYGDRLRFSVASLLNCMEQEEKRRYQREGIALHTLMETDRSKFAERAASCQADGAYLEGKQEKPSCPYQVVTIAGAVEARTGTDGMTYQNACDNLCREMIVKTGLNKMDMRGKKVLALGTEEFMFPGLCAAAQIEKLGADVRFHATTRGPVEVSCAKDYPLHIRYVLPSVYDRNRKTYFYNAAQYDKVYIFTDAPNPSKEAEYALVNALWECGNKDITIIYWQRP